MIVCGLLKPGSKLHIERELEPSGQPTLRRPLLRSRLTRPPPARHRAQNRPQASRRRRPDPLDVSYSFLEGSCNELAGYGYSRDHCRNRPELVYGLLRNFQGTSVALCAFSGRTSDPKSLAGQVCKLCEQFGLRVVVLVRDRSMIAQTRVRADLKPAGLDWITALRHSSVRKLANQKHVQPGLFDTYGMASITAPDFPGERLVVQFKCARASPGREEANELKPCIASQQV